MLALDHLLSAHVSATQKRNTARQSQHTTMYTLRTIDNDVTHHHR